MVTCETCKANKVCDHNKYGFENCNNYISADVVEVVRCKDCKYLKYGYQCYCPLGMNLSNNKDAYVLVNANEDFCSYGTPKERGADKPKITCLNCKHLMFSDMYGECNKQLRIVNPTDTCEYAELKERGGEK